MLTPKLLTLLTFIDDFTRAHGISPTYEEMRKHLGIRSKSGIYRHLRSLTERGYITSTPYRARTVQVIRMPGRNPEPDAPSPTATTPVPVYGRVDQSAPVAAIATRTRYVHLPRSMVCERDQYFAIENASQLLGFAGLLQNDILVLRRARTAVPGDFVLAVIDSIEAALARYYRNADETVRLDPGPDLSPRTIRIHRIALRGVLTGVLRDCRPPAPS